MDFGLGTFFPKSYDVFHLMTQRHFFSDVSSFCKWPTFDYFRVRVGGLPARLSYPLRVQGLVWTRSGFFSGDIAAVVAIPYSLTTVNVELHTHVPLGLGRAQRQQ